MVDEENVYQEGADEYDLLIAREDFQHNISSALEMIFHPDGMDIIDLGAGTGRLSSMFADKAGSVLACDASRHMLQVCHQKFQRVNRSRCWSVTADHRNIPVPRSSADIVLSGWSVSYLATWQPEAGEQNLYRWFSEMNRVLRGSGLIILLESLGTGNSQPMKLTHLSIFYDWLEKKQFQFKWIRTDYQFASLDEAVRLTKFFFGSELADRVRRENLVVLPECTGIWWLRKAASG